MAAPTSMTAETLNALKGWPAPHALDFEAKINSAITERVPRGAVVHVDSSGTFSLGVAAASKPMPLFLFPASDDQDVVNEAGDASTEAGVFVPISPTGVAVALVATGAYELTSTHYVDAAYAPNDKLTAAGGTDPTTGNAGKLVAGTLGSNVICGVVSRGVVNNGYGTNALAFWPVYLPNQ
jgi:hypothetical protein